MLSEVCAIAEVDVNGNRAPNAFGQDKFFFYFSKTGVVPMGTVDAVDAYKFEKCLDGTTGQACTAWVIYNENMDYLKCDDLNWDSKTKCD